MAAIKSQMRLENSKKLKFVKIFAFKTLTKSCFRGHMSLVCAQVCAQVCAILTHLLLLNFEAGISISIKCFLRTTLIGLFS